MNIRFPSLSVFADREPLRLAILITLLFVAVVHGLLLINDGVFWDGWIIYGAYLNKNPQPMLEMFREAGNPGFGLFHYLMAKSPLPLLLSYKLVAFLSIMISSALLVAILFKIKLFTQREALFIALMTVCYTAFQVSVEISIIPYLVCQCLFMIGAYLTLFPFRASRKTDLGGLVIAAICFLISFNLASLIALYLALLPAVILANNRTLSTFIPKGREQRLRVVAYIALPVLFVVTKRFWGKSSGLYSDYNQIRFDFSLLSHSVSAFIDNSILAQFADAAKFALTNPLSLAATSFMLFFATRKLLRHQPASPSENRLREWPLGLYAVFVLVLAIVPYALVGKPALASGWETRHALLVGFPVALGLVALGRAARREFRPETRLIGLAGLLLLASFGGLTWQNYMLWELRWVKDRSTIAALSASARPIIENASYVFVDDPDLIHNQEYFFYEYSGMFRVAFDVESRLANTAAEYPNLKQLAAGIPLKRYLLANFDGKGCSLLVAKRFQYPLTWTTVARYYVYRLTNPQKLGQFLVNGTALTWSDISQQRQTDLLAIKKAVEAYKNDAGEYPRGKALDLDLSELSRFLVPKYLPKIPEDPRFSLRENVRYIYFSDGKQFKIIAHNVEDVLCATRLHPEMEDPRRSGYAYGYWGPSAQLW